MVIKCPECKYKCELPFNLTFHYSVCHEDKTSKSVCGDKTLSGICIKELASPIKEFAREIKELAQRSCSFKDESVYNYSSNLRSSFTDSNLIIDSNSNSNCNLRSSLVNNEQSSFTDSSLSIDSYSNFNFNSNIDSNPNSNLNSNSYSI